MSENKVWCKVISAILCCAVVYCTVATSFIFAGLNVDESIAVVNGTLLSVQNCQYSCSTDEYGTTCYLKFGCAVEWNYGNSTYASLRDGVRWETESDNCTTMNLNSTVAVVVEKKKPDVLLDLEEYPYVYSSTIGMVGRSMVGIACFIIFVCIGVALWTCYSERHRNYDSV